jgi:ADP-ribose pyrophosphatase YjhB (NUDIX family)
MPDWLIWAREIQATAQTGLTFTQDPYDRERFLALQALAARIMADYSGVDADRIETLFAGQAGYATPKLGVRGAVFDAQGRVLLVRETADDHRWTLPGGWAEVNQTAAESVVREVFEESGYVVRPTKLAAAWDKARQTGLAVPFSITTLFFICTPEGGAPATSLETSEIAWFAEDALPADLSLRRTTPRQLARMFAHWRDPALPTDFD